MTEGIFPLPDGWRMKAIEKLNSKFKGGGKCPACEESTVTAGSSLVTVVDLDQDGSMQIGATIYPTLQLQCRNCGFSRYFNYLLLMNEQEATDAS